MMTNMRGIDSPIVAEHAFALMLALALGLERQGKAGVLAGAQARCAELERELERLREALLAAAGESDDEDTDSRG